MTYAGVVPQHFAKYWYKPISLPLKYVGSSQSSVPAKVSGVNFCDQLPPSVAIRDAVINCKTLQRRHVNTSMDRLEFKRSVVQALISMATSNSENKRSENTD